MRVEQTLSIKSDSAEPDEPVILPVESAAQNIVHLLPLTGNSGVSLWLWPPNPHGRLV